MAMIRVQKKEKFVVLDKTCSSDPELSWKAKGLHTYLMGLTDGWMVSINELARHSRDGYDSTLAGIKELIVKGYVKQIQSRNENGRFSRGDYIVYEIPQLGEKINETDTNDSTFSDEGLAKSNAKNMITSPQPENPGSVNPDADLPDTENPQLINNNINKYLNNKKITAAKVNSKTEVKTQTDFAAADTNFLVDDLKITSQLSDFQRQYIQQLAIQIEKSGIFQGDYHNLEEALEKTILDPSMFTQAGMDFMKKFNTLKKCVREGKWVPSTKSSITDGKSKKQCLSAIEVECQNLISEKNHWLSVLSNEKISSTVRENIRHILVQCEEKIQNLKAN